MTNFNYLEASLPELEALASRRGLPTEVTDSQASEYFVSAETPAGSFGPAVTEGYRRLVLLGRLAEDCFNNDTTPPTLIVAYAASKGLTHYAPPDRALEAYTRGLEREVHRIVGRHSSTLMYCGIAGRTLPVLISDWVSREHMTRLVYSLMDGGLSQSGVFSGIVERTSCRPGYLTNAIAYHYDASKGYLGVILHISSSEWAYVRIGSRRLGSERLPDIGHRSQYYTDLVGVDEWYNVCSGGLLKRVVGLPLESLGVHLTPNGLEYKVPVFFEGTCEEVSVAIGGRLLSSQVVRSLSASGYLYRVRPVNTDATHYGSFPEYLGDQIYANRLLWPGLLCLNDDWQYYGPVKYAEDPISALVIAYVQENRSILQRSPEMGSYRNDPRNTILGHLLDGIQGCIHDAEYKASTRLQVEKCHLLLERAGIAAKEDCVAAAAEKLKTKSLVEIFAEMETH